MNHNNSTKLHAIMLSVLTILAGQVIGCQRKHQASGGSVVGNGIIRYHDDAYDYYFEYAPELELQRISDAEIRLNNKKIVTSDSSEISFSIVKLNDSGHSSLESYAKAIEPTADWSSLNTGHIKGVFYRNQLAEKLDAKYIYKLNSDTLLEVQAAATAAGNGISLISNVLSSIDFDTTSPVIHEIMFEPSVATAGQTVKLKFRATDNMGTISGKSPTGSVGVRINETCRRLIDESWNGIDSCSNIESLGNDWYAFNVTTNERMREGQYLLQPLTVWDSAGNSLELIPDHGRGVYQSNNPEDQTLIPLAYLNVTNQKPDTEGPKLTNARFEKPLLVAGEESKLIFEATDNDPSFSLEKFCEKGRHRDWFTFSRTDIPSTPDIAPVEYAISACSTPVKRPDGSWEVNVTSEKGLPSGEYIIEFSVQDAVNNQSNMVSTRLFITNTENIDLAGPKVLALKTDKKSYKRGEQGRILIRATDDISGIKEPSGDAIINICRTGFVSKNRSATDRNATTRILVCDNSLKKIDGDWYAMDFKLAENVPTGTYVLPEIQISDRVGNTTSLTSSGETADGTHYNLKYSETATQVSILGVEIMD